MNIVRDLMRSKTVYSVSRPEIAKRRPWCDPPFETIILWDGAPHIYHQCPPCEHGQLRMYAYPLDEQSTQQERRRQALIMHARVDELTCLDHA